MLALNKVTVMEQVKCLGMATVFAFMLGACGGADTLVAAPLGEKAVLENLAEAYTEVSDSRLQMSPKTLIGKDRYDFVVRVFAEAGYDYSATLRGMAAEGLDNNNALHKDLAELALMPHRNQSAPVQPASIYSSDELMDIAILERQLKQ